MVTLQTDSIISGPLKTERLGIAMGIDVSAPDIAIVVSRERRLPRASVIVTTVAQHLIRHSKAGEKINSIVVASSGNDPTRHPNFKEISENLRELRNKWYPKAKLCVLCDDADLENPAARTALGIYDLPICSLEWGTSKTYAALTKRKSTSLNPLVKSLKTLEQIVVQARFVRGKADNSTANEIKGWIKRLEEVRPKEVQILTPAARSTKKTTSPRPVPKSRLEEIAAAVTEQTGIPAAIYADESILV